MTYALFKKDKQISKSHSTMAAVIAECFELGIVNNCYADFPNDTSGQVLQSDYKIKETT